MGLVRLREFDGLDFRRIGLPENTLYATLKWNIVNKYIVKKYY